MDTPVRAPYLGKFAEISIMHLMENPCKIKMVTPTHPPNPPVTAHGAFNSYVLLRAESHSLI